jgi:hypothetical protein
MRCKRVPPGPNSSAPRGPPIWHSVVRIGCTTLKTDDGGGGPLSLSATTLALALSLLRPTSAALIFRDEFAVVNASCGDTACTDCTQKCASCPWDLSLTACEYTMQATCCCL